jgi:DNA polymerase
VIGTRAVRLYPLYHPAAALYTPRMLEVLREDFARIPALLARPAPAQPAPIEPVLPVEPEARAVSEIEEPLAHQLGLF